MRWKRKPSTPTRCCGASCSWKATRHAPGRIHPGKTVVEMLERDLVVEYEVRAALAAGMKLCEEHGDYVSRDVLLKQLQDTEEDHAWWLEQQLGLIKRIGLELYQTSKIDKGHVAG